jgi:hypothetical protein
MPIGTKLKGDYESDRGLFGLLASWERTLRGAKKSQKTISTYLLGVRSLNSWCIDQEREFGLGRDLVLDYLIDSLEAGLAASSLESYLKGIKVFAKWLHAEGEIEAYELTNVAAPKPDEVILPSVSPPACTGCSGLARRKPGCRISAHTCFAGCSRTRRSTTICPLAT